MPDFFFTLSVPILTGCGLVREAHIPTQDVNASLLLSLPVVSQRGESVHTREAGCRLLMPQCVRCGSTPVAEQPHALLAERPSVSC